MPPVESFGFALESGPQPGKPIRHGLPFWEPLPRISGYTWRDCLYAGCCT